MSVLSRCSRPVSRLSLPTSLRCLAPFPPRTPTVLVHLLRSTHNATNSNNPVTALESRGLVTSLSRLNQLTIYSSYLSFHSPAVVEHAQSPTTIYCGVDPTAPSLHLGNFITLMGLLHFHVRGHQAIALIGGATGSIGDPSGRKTERVPLSVDTLELNIRGIRTQLERFFARGTEYAASRGVSWAAVADLKVVNNADWMRDMSALKFLSDVGRFARVGTMLARESASSFYAEPILPTNPQRQVAHGQRSRHQLHRVLVPASAGVRFLAPVSCARMPDPAWRQRSVGQYHSGD
ncbi:hypothetical protein BC938DRAFT_478239 [Jimgerdemannia flammicorona]|uniref:tyrosine--tRNA ligase n=1 Tax=Jimgerdemannia flammicorona TaxID=994334 RepID=A0A433QN53_9FUNG|nr:hypothetical protein BC938DRAFT_478239 [Jimgerdemannia flammicorona]